MNKNAATYVGRVIIALFGLGLLALSIKLKVWWTGDIQEMMLFGALIGLFVGYGFGGDMWGARLFDFFTFSQSRKVAEEPLSPGLQKFAQILGVFGAGFLALAFVFFMVVLMRGD